MLPFSKIAQIADVICKVYLFLINIDFVILTKLVVLWACQSLLCHKENLNLSEIGPSLFGLQLVSFSALFMLVQAQTSTDKQSVGILID